MAEPRRFRLEVSRQLASRAYHRKPRVEVAPLRDAVEIGGRRRLVEERSEEGISLQVVHGPDGCGRYSINWLMSRRSDLALASLTDAGFYLRDLESVAPPSSATYERWFGDLTVDRWLLVTTRVGEIRQDLPATAYTCRANGFVLGTDIAGNVLTCGGSLIAVTSGGRTSVDLCPGFFGLSDADSASFLVHELSHQDRTAPRPLLGTDDIAGPEDVDILNLAVSDPDSAVRNSYSFQRFVAEF